MKVHVIYAAVIIVLTAAGFFIGRRTAQRSELREIVSDPKMMEAAKAVNALNDFSKAFRERGADMGKAAEAVDKEAEAERKRYETATNVARNGEVRVTVEKFYRGGLLQDRSFGSEEKKPFDFDCLAVRFKVENISQNVMLDISCSKAIDNFGNVLDDKFYFARYDVADVQKRLEMPDQSSEKLAPGESRSEFVVFKKPLPNAEWYGLEIYVHKSSDPLVTFDMPSRHLYLKVRNKAG